MPVLTNLVRPPVLVAIRRGALEDLPAVIEELRNWELSAAVTGEAIDGMAITLSRSVAENILYRCDDIGDDAFLMALADALLVSGLAMSVAGNTRPCSGGCHELSHAIDTLFPGKADLHGNQVGVGAALTAHLRGEAIRAAQIAGCLRRHRLPVLPQELGLSQPEFVQALSYAPRIRPDRYTILEHLTLDEPGLRDAVGRYVRAFG